MVSGPGPVGGLRFVPAKVDVGLGTPQARAEDGQEPVEAVGRAEVAVPVDGALGVTGYDLGEGEDPIAAARAGDTDLSGQSFGGRRDPQDDRPGQGEPYAQAGKPAAADPQQDGATRSLEDVARQAALQAPGLSITVRDASGRLTFSAGPEAPRMALWARVRAWFS